LTLQSLAYAALWVLALDDHEMNDTCVKLSELIRLNNAATELALIGLAAVCEKNDRRQAAYVERVGCGALLVLDKAGCSSARAAIVALESVAAFLAAGEIGKELTDDDIYSRVLAAQDTPPTAAVLTALKQRGEEAWAKAYPERRGVNATISTCWMEGEVKDDAGFAYLIKCSVPNFCGLNDCDPGVPVGYTRVGKVPAGSKFAVHWRQCEEDPTLAPWKKMFRRRFVPLC